MGPAGAGGAEAGDVAKTREREHTGEYEEADTGIHHVEQRHRDERARDPDELEAGFEAGERSAAEIVGSVALQQTVERDLAGGGTHGNQHRCEDEAPPSTGACCPQCHDGREEQGRNQHPLLTEPPAQQRGHDVADEAAQRAKREDHTEEPRGLAFGLEGKGDEERQEPDSATEQCHGTSGQHDARRVKLGPFCGRLRHSFATSARNP